MSYDVSIQPRGSGITAERSRVEAFIASLPGVRQESPGEFAYGDKRRRLHVHIYTGETDKPFLYEITNATDKISPLCQGR